MLGRTWVLALAVFGWSTVAVDAVLWDDLMPREMTMLVLSLSIVVTLGWLLARMRLPIDDVFEAGREAGRREAVRERSRAVSDLAGRRVRLEATRPFQPGDPLERGMS